MVTNESELKDKIEEQQKREHWNVNYGIINWS